MPETAGARAAGRVRLVAAALAVAVAATGCGEPAVDLDVPDRRAGQHVLDTVGLLDGTDVAAQLAALAEEGLDVVAVVYETPQAGLGEGRRAGQLVVREWEADVALVAVAAPGDFTSGDTQARRRFFGLEPADAFAVPRGLRERVAEQRAPPLAEANDWPGVFTMAIEEIARELLP
ncbi:MAG TPA: hypothetical protein VM324_09925 [Egibacteraceae bacterium]|jgi:hypothetical protein|nr:hypothetical protein [Egibacteraceae bacterium]